VHPHAVAGGEPGHGAQLPLLDAFNDRAHGGAQEDEEAKKKRAPRARAAGES
jgi:hypothetical protein